MVIADAVNSWTTQFRSRLNSRGWSCAMKWAFWHFSWEIPRKLAGVSGYDGKNVYEEDWDILILLDAMRTDLLEETISQSEQNYDWLGKRSKIPSISGKSSGWMKETFENAPPQELQETIYITGNPHTDWLFDQTSITPGDFADVEELWQSNWNDEIGTVPPRPITDRGIAIGRECDYDRIILHYMQPHFPSIAEPLGSRIDLDDSSWDWSVWQQLKRGEISKSEVWSSYRENLKYVLEDVQLLLENIDAETAVVSADHGNAIGERGYFGHDDWPVKEIKMVPWCVTTGRDTESYSPQTAPPNADNTDTDVESRLTALGYR